jgi:hypothetical protein
VLFCEHVPGCAGKLQERHHSHRARGQQLTSTRVRCGDCRILKDLPAQQEPDVVVTGRGPELRMPDSVDRRSAVQLLWSSPPGKILCIAQLFEKVFSSSDVCLQQLCEKLIAEVGIHTQLSAQRILLAVPDLVNSQGLHARLVRGLVNHKQIMSSCCWSCATARSRIHSTFCIGSVLHYCNTYTQLSAQRIASSAVPDLQIPQAWHARAGSDLVNHASMSSCCWSQSYRRLRFSNALCIGSVLHYCNTAALPAE